MRRSPRGLTFLEIEIALLLLLLGVLAVIEISPLAMQGVRLAEQHAMAGQIAQHVLENEMARTHDAQLAVLSTVSRGKIVSGTAGSGEIQVPGATDDMYTYTVVRQSHPTLGSDVIIITVEVQWRDPNMRRYNRSTPDRTLRIVGYKTS